MDAAVGSLFDRQFKHVHEYRRQIFNCLYIIHRCFIKQASPSERAKIIIRTSFIGGNAAPAYVHGKTIIKLVGNISEVVNNDPEVSPVLGGALRAQLHRHRGPGHHSGLGHLCAHPRQAHRRPAPPA